MTAANIALLADRGVVRVAGEDAEKLLQGLVTNDMGRLRSQPAMHAALLTPQGKILFDFFVVQAGGGFLLEVARDKAADLAERLGLYKLRAKVAIEDVSSLVQVWSVWGADVPSLRDDHLDVVDDTQDLEAYDISPCSFRDPRLATLGERWVLPKRHAERILEGNVGLTRLAAEAYHAHRIALGVPEGGKDYALGDTFAHEADLDRLEGVSFTKGCYVGQEVVSRMQNRANVRKRVVPVEGEAPLTSGAEVRAGAAAIGSVGSVAGKRGLALLRLDRAAEAAAKGQPLSAGGVAITLRKPAWAAFELAPPAGAEAP